MISLVNEYTAVLDACVLAPMPICDTLLRLAEKPALYIPKWSPDIIDEVARYLKERSYTPAQVMRRLDAMQAHFEDALVEGYDSLIPAMTCHRKDRHVLAAAVACKADAIVTFNTRDFPESSTNRFGIEVLHPDEFLVNPATLFPSDLPDKLNRQASTIGQPLRELLARLRPSAPNFVERARALTEAS